ncbi:MAG: serine/threonine-protein kinase [Acidobacteriota bacterium]|nr:serine/threonine-protein kinase [Acidobacteriota bacterium]
MSTLTGTRLGPYDIVSALGAGGMGEVYRARDSRLDRDVAIKILPPAFAGDGDRLARFEREAKTLASLNHPNIAQIYGIEEVPPTSSTGRTSAALVMELVPGEDLSARISRGPVPLAEALPIAQQIADALEAAHERGVIHRDLKPANVKVTTDGVVKVLDFGLAKAMTASDEDVNQANSPTIAFTGTQAGLILGTAGYMAPEQARGHSVDRRVDVWAFGVVLFEMLTGRQAFAGETISDVLASVLKNDLDWTALPRDLPVSILKLLRRCLDPDRRSRLRDIGEARIAIGDYLAGRAEPTTTRDVRGTSSRFLIVGALGALALAAIASALTWNMRDRVEPEPPRRYVVAAPEISTQVEARPAITLAPDGWTLVFVGVDKGVSSLYVRGPGDFDPRKLPGTEYGSNPVFSPSGKLLAFVTGNKLMMMALDGAPSQLAAVNDPRGLSWVDEKTIVYSGQAVAGLTEVSVTGGSPRVLTTLNKATGERSHRWPHALPGGQWVLFTLGTTASPDSYDSSRIDAINRQTGERREVYQNASMARYAPTGHLLLSRAGSLFAAPFDPVTLKLSGTPVSIAQGITGDGTTGAAHIAWSDNGTLAYLAGDQRGSMRQLAFVDFAGTRTGIRLPDALYNDIRVSPDGKRLAFTEGTSGLGDIWVYSFERGTRTRLTFSGIAATPVWSADGRDIVYAEILPDAKGTRFSRTSADGGREPVSIGSAVARVYLKHVSADGAWALIDYVNNTGNGAGRVLLQPDATIEPLVNTKADDFGATLSPDGRFVAYNSDEGGAMEVFVRELRGSTGRWQVSNAGGEEPMWSPDGRAIFYRSESRLMRVAVETTPTFRAGLPSMLFDGVYIVGSDTGISYEPHPDGKRLLMTRGTDDMSIAKVRIVTRWFDELKALK